MLIIVLVNYNAWEHTIECLESILHGPKFTDRIVIVDNASTDSSLDRLRMWAKGELSAWVAPSSPHHCRIVPPIPKPIPLRIVNEKFQNLEDSNSSEALTLVVNNQNTGFGAGNNLGMSMGALVGRKQDYFWLLNNDTVIDGDSVEIIKKVIRQKPIIYGLCLMDYLRPDEIQTTGGFRLTKLGKRSIPSKKLYENRWIDYIHGASMIFPVSYFLKNGGFDEKIFMYYEDVDFCLNARSLGYEFAVIPAKVFHKGGMSSNSYFQWLMTYRHKHYVLHKHFGWGLWVIAYYWNLLAVKLYPFTPLSKSRAAFTVFIEKLFSKSTNSGESK